MKDLEVESKYYTPSLDEFCIGFEYEEYHTPVRYKIQNEQWCKWNKKIYKGLEFVYIDYSINDLGDWSIIPIDKSLIRVKYLDQSDIEELGWEDQEVDTEKFIAFKKGKFRLDLHNNIVVIYKADHWSVFQGIIKNKSELKKLMKQLNIEGNED